MSKAEDLTDKVFGYLKVLGRAQDRETPSGKKRRFWRCECQLCGAKKDIAAQHLKRGSTKSCGCLAVVKGKATRNKKICVVCGKEFESPPSDKTTTCSQMCRSIRASRTSIGRKMEPTARAKISEAACGRDMSELQIIATVAAQKSPNSGRFITNVNAIDWHLISPEGKHYYFHSLSFWLRENCRKLFGCEPDSQEYQNARSGLTKAKAGAMGKVSCCTYKGWRVLPTVDDIKRNQMI